MEDANYDPTDELAIRPGSLSREAELAKAFPCWDGAGP